MTNEPAFKPGEWVIYELEDSTTGFGQILGGLTSENVWTYNVHGPALNGDGVQVPEKAVKFTLENGNWTAPTHFGGSNSVYANMEEGTI